MLWKFYNFKMCILFFFNFNHEKKKNILQNFPTLPNQQTT